MTARPGYVPRAFDVACPNCDAAMNQECIGVTWRPGMNQTHRFHPERRRLVRKKPEKGGPSRIDLAIEYMREHNTSGDAAGAAFGISRQGIYKTLSNRGELPPLREQRVERRMKLIEFADDGLTARGISEALGLAPDSVRTIATAMGVEITSARINDEDFERGFDAIRQGKTVTEAAFIAGCSSGRFAQRMKANGLRSQHRGGNARWGISERAYDLMTSEGLSISEAAHRIGVAPNVFMSWLRRNGHLA